MSQKLYWVKIFKKKILFFILGLSTYCLQFYYHMLGNPDTLMVDFGERYSQGSTVWSVSGDQGDQWNYQQVEIDATTVNDPVVSFFFNLIFFLKNYRGTCLIRHTKGSGKCVGCHRMSKNSSVGFHKFRCIYKITAVMKVDTDIISSIVASPIGTSWDTSDNVCQNLKI